MNNCLRGGWVGGTGLEGPISLAAPFPFHFLESTVATWKGTDGQVFIIRPFLDFFSPPPVLGQEQVHHL